MTWNSAFPSSPLSRSALRGDTGLTNGHATLRASTPPQCYLDDASEASTSYRRSYRRVVSQPEGQQLQAAKGSQLGGQELDMARRRALKSSSTSAMLGLPPSSSSPPWSRATPGSPGSPVSPRAGLGSPRRRVSAPGGPSPTATLSSSLVGSYEESLLSGRMSTNPSRPLPFDAELGVLGLGKLGSAPRCPPHLQLRFDAHFYALDGTSAREGTVAPGTPYVGTVDLERHYMDSLYRAPRAESAEDGPGSSRATQSSGLPERSSHPYREGTAQLKRTHVERDVFGGTGAKPALFPGYRVPPKGQIQLVIKNPNLTAVKLFLVPYDLTEMPPGTKTFVRQKSHVATAGATDANAKTTTASPKIPPRSPADLRNSHRDTLRYAIHLQFCCPPTPQPRARRSDLDSHPQHSQRTSRHSTGAVGNLPAGRHPAAAEPLQTASRKIYLHKTIRVVFAASQPDNSEKLTTVTETPGGSAATAMWATYTGPGQEWIQAKRRARETLQRERDLSRERIEGSHPAVLEAEAVLAGEAAASMRRQPSHEPLDIPRRQSLSTTYDTHSSGSGRSIDSTQAGPVCFQAAEMDDGARHRSRRRGGSTMYPPTLDAGRHTQPEHDEGASITAQSGASRASLAPKVMSPPSNPPHHRHVAQGPFSESSDKLGQAHAESTQWALTHRAMSPPPEEVPDDRALLNAWAENLRRTPAYQPLQRPTSPSSSKTTPRATSSGPSSPPALRPLSPTAIGLASPTKARGKGASRSPLIAQRTGSPVPGFSLAATATHGLDRGFDGMSSLTASLEDLSMFSAETCPNDEIAAAKVDASDAYTPAGPDRDAASAPGRPVLGRRISSTRSVGLESGRSSPISSVFLGAQAERLSRSRSGSVDPPPDQEVVQTEAVAVFSRPVYAGALAPYMAKRSRAGSLLALGPSSSLGPEAGPEEGTDHCWEASKCNEATPAMPRQGR
ncbi:hypothetical protein IE81DRAFT_319925 [Ceraceosorus guamensis]|uniref:Atos-like conserved domain-containing protein n=1 Tax=Ceraceosorus guamensis TaxID=1522189 RepID=A0A316W997_9BASI|nr:hypothetical protein IE81DRAFT_319925 [Ceraceosorus guamensis]PWN45638.1 hypothetical protein IE81DRAFT_319925 [Ceraceosorus guamensis]